MDSTLNLGNQVKYRDDDIKKFDAKLKSVIKLAADNQYRSLAPSKDAPYDRITGEQQRIADTVSGYYYEYRDLALNSVSMVDLLQKLNEEYYTLTGQNIPVEDKKISWNNFFVESSDTEQRLSAVRGYDYKSERLMALKTTLQVYYI